MTGEPLLRVTNLDVDYAGVKALRGINIEVQELEPAAIIGPNGAGKTTLLKAICGVQKASAGDIFFRGTRINDCPAHEIVRLGISQVPEGRRIFPYLSVYENLRMGSYVERRRPKFSANLEKVFGLFPELKKRGNQPGGTLSGGEQQMLSIGRALMRDVSLLLMDEPTVGLSPLMVQILFDRISELTKAGTSLLLVEQNVRMALALSRKCYLMNIGKIELCEPSERLEHDERIQQTYLGGV